MKQTLTILQKIRQLLIILVPILVAQVTMFSMSFFDTVMSGQASTQDLAGVAIGSSIWVPIGAGLGGICVAVTPIVAHLIGAKRKEDIAFKVIQGALRGYKDVNVTFITAFISYWMIGLPAGYYMASYTSLGAAGYWIGLILGLAVSAVGLSVRFLIVQRRRRTIG